MNIPDCSKFIVLTAAHAVDDGQCPDAVRIGSYQRTEGGDLVSVKPGSCL